MAVNKINRHCIQNNVGAATLCSLALRTVPARYLVQQHRFTWYRAGRAAGPYIIWRNGRAAGHYVIWRAGRV